MNAFLPADILMPKTDHMEKWAVIACDQFTSDQAYWDRVRKNAEGAVSTINLILPEAELGTEKEAEHTAEINATMKKYMEDGVFTVYPNSYVYVERTLENGSIREGLSNFFQIPDGYEVVLGNGGAEAKAGTYANADGTVATEDGTWDYANEVVYPFGYGLSYTTFEQTLDSVTIADDKKTATVTVTDAFSSFIITPSMAVAVIRRLMAAMAVSEALCRSPAFWDRAVVRISSTRASPPHMVMRSSASCSV